VHRPCPPWRSAAPMVIIIHAYAVAYVALPPVGVAAMVKNLVAGCVLVALIFMALLAYAQEHHECLNGHLIVRGHLFKGLRSCGSVSPSM